MELDNKVCVITGGASGIGAATCRAFAAKGARVVVTDINMEGARQVAEEIGGHAITCDVSVEAEVNNLVAETEEQLGPIDLFFNNAAVATGGNPLNTPIDVWQDQWNINVTAFADRFAVIERFQSCKKPTMFLQIARQCI